MEINLFSSQGEPSLRNIVEASSPFLEKADDPAVAYLPAACVGERYVGLTKTAFKGLADVLHLDPETQGRARVEAALDKAAILYIPGGNTYLLAHRLHNKDLVAQIRERIINGLPLVAFSAGTVLCGANVLTTNDLNCCGCTTFNGLGFVPFNFNVHYPSDEGDQREFRDERLWEYQEFNSNPVLALEDSAHIRVTDSEVRLISGNCWLFEKGQARTKVEIGRIL